MKEPEKETEEAGSSSWPSARQIIGGVIATVALVFILATYFFEDLQVCRDRLVDSGQTAEICGPVGNDDLVFVGIALLVALLFFWPDFSEISLPGLVTLKRRVEKQEERTDELARIIQQLSVSQTMTVQVIPADPRELKESADEKLSQVEQGNVPTVAEEPSLQLRQPTPERAVLEAILLRSWERIAEYAQPARGRGRAIVWSDEEYLPAWLRQWRRTFAEEIEGLRLARNTVAHRPENLSDEGLRRWLEVANTLLRSIETERNMFERVPRSVD